MAAQDQDDMTSGDALPEEAASFRQRTHVTPDIAEELNSLIPDELIEERPCRDPKIRPVKWLTRLYLLAVIILFGLTVSSDVEPFSPACSMIFFVAGPSVVALWAYRVKNNAVLMGAKLTTITPLYGALSLVIPMYNTFAILPVYQELWKTSRNPRHWERVRNHPLIIAWYALRLIMLGGVISYGFQSNPGLGIREDPIMIGLVLPLAFATAILEVVTVVMISRAQEASYKRHAEQSAPDSISPL